MAQFLEGLIADLNFLKLASSCIQVTTEQANELLHKHSPPESLLTRRVSTLHHVNMNHRCWHAVHSS